MHLHPKCHESSAAVVKSGVPLVPHCQSAQQALQNRMVQEDLQQSFVLPLPFLSMLQVLPSAHKFRFYPLHLQEESSLSLFSNNLRYFPLPAISHLLV